MTVLDSPQPDEDAAAAVHALIVRHAHAVDRGDPVDIVELFTEDATWLGMERPLHGRGDIRRWATQRAARSERVSRHVHTNISLTALADDRIAGSMVTLLFRHDGGGAGPATPLLVLDYDDLYCRVDDRWLIHRRTMRRVFVDADRFPSPR